MRIALEQLLRRLINAGQFTVTWPDKRQSRYGNAGTPRAAIRITDDATIRRLVLNPALILGEAYMDGTLVPDGCSIYDVLHVLMLNIGAMETHPVVRARAAIRKLMRPIAQANTALQARRNIAHHYDLNGKLYSLFLDQDQQYSCGYFPNGNETIDEAQIAKKRHIAAKLMIDRPDLTVLDIGCGWGGMALTLAQDYGARVTGITLSTEQLDVARCRAAAAGLADRVKFELIDYRLMHQRFDRIVSVGMFEHVGVPNYSTFFEMIKRCLEPDGIVLLHAIGRFEPPGGTNPWMAKYIFPGGYSPALSEVFAAIEKSGLRSADIEVLRLHYARTLAHWSTRFAATRDVIESLYDERFCRMFEFYLAGAELSFRVQDLMVFQIQLIRQNDAAPLTRDYIIDGERRAGAPR
jgi:cyclopropane-fatty-acyl-phospholipid synthase